MVHTGLISNLRKPAQTDVTQQGMATAHGPQEDSPNLLGNQVRLYCGLSLGWRHMPHLDIAVAIVVLAPATKGMAEVLTHMSPAASRHM